MERGQPSRICRKRSGGLRLTWRKRQTWKMLKTITERFEHGILQQLSCIIMVYSIIIIHCMFTWCTICLSDRLEMKLCVGRRVRNGRPRWRRWRIHWRRRNVRMNPCRNSSALLKTCMPGQSVHHALQGILWSCSCVDLTEFLQPKAAVGSLKNLALNVNVRDWSLLTSN